LAFLSYFPAGLPKNNNFSSPAKFFRLSNRLCTWNIRNFRSQGLLTENVYRPRPNFSCLGLRGLFISFNPAYTCIQSVSITTRVSELRLMAINGIAREWLSNCCLTPSEHFFWLYRGENKLFFYEMMIITALY
jgi:hypothetical protein